MDRLSTAHHLEYSGLLVSGLMRVDIWKLVTHQITTWQPLTKIQHWVKLNT